MQQAAYRVSQGDFSAQVNVEAEDEIGQLAKTFNQMAKALAQEDERKKNF